MTILSFCANGNILLTQFLWPVDQSHLFFNTGSKTRHDTSAVGILELLESIQNKLPCDTNLTFEFKLKSSLKGAQIKKAHLIPSICRTIPTH